MREGIDRQLGSLLAGSTPKMSWSPVGDPLADLKAAVKLMNNLPPAPKAILTHMLVPSGKVYRQWDTKGRLFLWVNSLDIWISIQDCCPPLPMELRNHLSGTTIGVPIIDVEKDRFSSVPERYR